MSAAQCFKRVVLLPGSKITHSHVMAPLWVAMSASRTSSYLDTEDIFGPFTIPDVQIILRLVFCEFTRACLMCYEFGCNRRFPKIEQNIRLTSSLMVSSVLLKLCREDPMIIQCETSTLLFHPHHFALLSGIDIEDLTCDASTPVLAGEKEN